MGRGPAGGRRRDRRALEARGDPGDDGDERAGVEPLRARRARRPARARGDQRASGTAPARRLRARLAPDARRGRCGQAGGGPLARGIGLLGQPGGDRHGIAGKRTCRHVRRDGRRRGGRAGQAGARHLPGGGPAARSRSGPVRGGRGLEQRAPGCRGRGHAGGRVPEPRVPTGPRCARAGGGRLGPRARSRSFRRSCSRGCNVAG